MSSPGDPPASLPFAAGDVVANKYRIDQEIGRGGMGIVFAATDITLDRRVAMKVLIGQRGDDADGVARFLREGRAVVKLTSDHVARVFEVGTSREGAPFMIMEYLDGCDLAAEIARRGALPVEEAIGYVLQACEAIAEAHALGIVHRDLKPHNLFLARRPGGRVAVRVLDFGISKMIADDAPSGLTTTGASLGTPLYMAPEQMRSSRDVDARADIWALGVILYELLTGRAPFLGASVAAIAILVANEPPPPPRSLRPDLPEALAKAILRCLEKLPAARYASVDALVGDLEPFGSRVPAARASGPDVSVPKAPPSADELADTHIVAASGPGTIARVVSTDVSWGTTRGDPVGRRRSTTRTRFAALFALVAAAVVAGYLLWTPRPPVLAPPPTSPATATSPPLSDRPGNDRVDPAPAPNAGAPATASSLSANPSAPGAPSVPRFRTPSPSRPPGTSASPRSSATKPAAAPTTAIDPGSIR